MSAWMGALRKTTRAALVRLPGRRHGSFRAASQGLAPLVDHQQGVLEAGLFVNPIAEGADPYVVRHAGGYLWCQTAGDVGVAIWRSDRLTSLGEKHVVWNAPEAGPWSQQVWAPELHRLDGRWYVYVAASDGRNENHLAYVLVADTDDPVGPYSLQGPFNTGDGAGGTTDNAWAIDMTVLEHRGRRYAVWSGWPDATTRVQHLYIAEMASPTSLAGKRVQLSSPFDYPWERIRHDREHALNEAPQALVSEGRTFLVYSCGSALLPSYKLGLLELVGNDPLDAASWRKRSEPLFAPTESTYGVGHSSFVLSPDGAEWWQAYHAKIARERSFERVIHVQPMTWSPEREPVLGEPVPAGVPLEEPSGTHHEPRHGSHRWHFTPTTAVLSEFDYYGHQQLLTLGPSGLQLGRAPDHPVNTYRSGEKLVLRDGRYSDVRVAARLVVADGSRAAGVLLRVSGPAVGFEAQRGYFAGWAPRSGRLVLRRFDGGASTELASLQVRNPPPSSLSLVADMVGSTISVHLESEPDSVLRAQDRRYEYGSVGLRVGHSEATFNSFSVAPLGP